MQYLPQIARLRFDKLPGKLRGVILGTDTLERIEETERRYELSDEQTRMLGRLTGYVLMGLLDRSSFADALQDECNLPDTTTRRISSYIDDTVFEPVRTLIKDAAEMPPEDPNEITEEDTDTPTNKRQFKEGIPQKHASTPAAPPHKPKLDQTPDSHKIDNTPTPEFEQKKNEVRKSNDPRDRARDALRQNITNKAPHTSSSEKSMHTQKNDQSPVDDEQIIIRNDTQDNINSVKVGGFTSHNEGEDEGALNREDILRELEGNKDAPVESSAPNTNNEPHKTDNQTNDPDARYGGADPYREPVE